MFAMGLEFAMGFLVGAICAVAIGAMSMKRSGWQDRDEDNAPAKRADGTRPGSPKLRTRHDAEAILKSRVFHLMWNWIYTNKEGTTGEWRLRPVMPPEDAKWTIHL